METTHSSNQTSSPSLSQSEKPTQIKFLRPAQMALFARIITYPPLGQVSIIPPSRKEFDFTVVIESSTSLPDQPWEVVIWYDHSTCYGTYDGKWASLWLRKVDHGPPVMYRDQDEKTYRYTFEGNLPTPFPDNARTYKGRKVPFTVCYRINNTSPWMWVYETQAVSDGEVILQAPVDPNYLGGSPVELNDGWFTRKLTSEAPDAKLYSLESSATIPYDGNSAKEECLPLGMVYMPHRWFALVRIWEPWLAPRHGQQRFHLTEPAILLSFLRTDGLHVVVLAVNGVDDVLTVLRSDDDGNIVVCARNDTGRDRKFKVLAASAYSFEVANAAVMYEMRKLVKSSSAYQDVAKSLPTHIRTDSIGSDTVLVSNMYDDRNPAEDNSPTPQWLQSWYDSLAYCTWNSLGQDLNLEKILEGLDSLEKNNIHIVNLIIDDNWQSLTGTQGSTGQFERGWTDFEANKQGFPDGLKAAVDQIRAKHPRIREIAVWHALMGYWGCVSPDTGHISKDYKLRQVAFQEGRPKIGTKHVVDASDIHRMYDDFYSFLSSCGITAVKTDVQFYLDLLGDTVDRRDLTIPYQSAWTQAHLKHLAGKAISCMSQIPQILYHSFLPTNTPRIMLRNSDDFFPDVPRSHPWHVFSNAHAALFVQHLNVLPDWDMFQTSHAYSGFHAASRCISGGPIYITDYPNQHNVDLIHQMTAVNPRGDTVVLRPSNVGRSMSVYDSYEGGAVLKVGVYDGRADVGTGLMGIFNVAEQPASLIIPITRIPGVRVNPGDEEHKRSWVVWSHMSRKASGPITPTLPVQSSSLLQATLPVRGYDIWSAIPVHGPFHTADGSFDVAVLGLLGKMTGACALVGSRFSSKPADDDGSGGGRLRVEVVTKALGVLGIWISDVRGKSVQDNLLVVIKGQSIPAERVTLEEDEEEIDNNGVTTTTTTTTDVEEEQSRRKPGILHIDIEGAWNDLQLDSGWSNEVTTEVFIS